MAIRKKIPLIPTDATLTIGTTKTLSTSVNFDVSGADVTIVGSGTNVITAPGRSFTLDNLTTASTTDLTGFIKGDGSVLSADNSTYQATLVTGSTYTITSSWSNNALTASSINFVPLTSTSASWVSASVKITTADTASYVAVANIDGTPLSATSASYASSSTSASHALSASWAPDVTIMVESASWASSSISSSFSTNAGTAYAINFVPLTSNSASWVSASAKITTADTASYILPENISNTYSASVSSEIGLKQDTLTNTLYVITASLATSASYSPVEPAYSSSISTVKQNTLIAGNTYTITSSWATTATAISFVPLTSISASWVSASVKITTADTASYILVANIDGTPASATSASWASSSISMSVSSTTNNSSFYPLISPNTGSNQALFTNPSLSYNPSTTTMIVTNLSSSNLNVSSSATINNGLYVPSGSVGIGTTTPTNSLDVSGNISCSVITASLFGTATSASYASASSIAYAINFVPNTALTSTQSLYSTQSIYASSSLVSISASWASSSISSSNADTLDGLHSSSFQATLITGNTYTITSSYAIWADNVNTASYVTASNLAGTVTSASYSISSSFSTNTETAYAINFVPLTSNSASWVSSSAKITMADTASYIDAGNISNTYSASVSSQIGLKQNTLTNTLYTITASLATSASYSPVEPAYSSSISTVKQNTLIAGNTYTITSSWATTSTAINFVPLTSTSASWVSASAKITTADTASYILASNISNAYSASISSQIGLKQDTLIDGNTYVITSSWSNNTLTASSINFVPSTSTSASWVSASAKITTADTASLALNSIQSTFATQSLFSTQSIYASSSLISISSSYASASAKTAITDDTTTDAFKYLTFVDDTGNQPVKISSTKLVFNPSTNAVGIGTINPTKTLDVVGTYGTNGSDLLTIQNNKSQAGALYFDGTTTSARIYHTLDATYLASTSDFTIFSRFMAPATAPATGHYPSIFGLSSNNASIYYPYAAYIYINPDGSLNLVFYGATTNDFNRAIYANFITNYAGKIVDIVFVRNTTNSTVALYINGMAQTLSTTTGGTPPTWAGSITSTYAIIGAGSTDSLPYNDRIYKTSLFNRALTAAEIIQLRERGTAWADLGGSFLPKLNSSNYLGATILNGDFETTGSGGADPFANWTESVSGTSTINDETSVVHAGGHACRMDVDSSNSLVKIYMTALTIGKRYKFTVWAKVSDATLDPTLQTDSLGVSGNMNLGTLTTTYTKYIVEGIANRTTADLKRGSYMTSKSLYIDDVKIEQIGEVLNSDLEHADPAKSTVVTDLSSNNYIGTVTTTGVSQIKPTSQIGNLFFNSTGKIGIGLTNPTNSLDVLGNISCSVITASILNSITSSTGAVTQTTMSAWLNIVANGITYKLPLYL